MRAPKFRNVPTIVDGVSYASKKEARRASELKLLERGGQIRGLTFQPRFPLKVNDRLVCTYVADASYVEDGIRIVEDTKSEVTRKHPVYRIKAKLFQAIYGFPIREV